ncbi:glycosyltransferase family 2 protein [Thalassotalea litorea]|uniref:Glycosyltransferase family 2 protein n=1 Tax=Thalassotalea litorea TaxID=2020715 RepID=A0A5R9IPE8_9GAMM|nr:glycosyltransferase family 2 protein [Thalassotalea litorea]TLU65131.1 glycosyltransferase family 2 protein [Thalassotalea litorea]
MSSSVWGKLALLCIGYLITGSIIWLYFHSTPQFYADLEAIRIGIFLLLAPILSKYLIQLFALPIYSFRQRRINRKARNIKPKSVSVLIPAYNEATGIIGTIESVVNNQYPDLEIIVINDGSSDETHDLVQDYLKKFSSRYFPKNRFKPDIKYLYLKNGGKATALNKGLKLATKDIVMTIDGDCLMANDAIKNTVKQFQSSKVGAVAGNVVIANKQKIIGLVQQLEYLCGFFLRRADSVFNSVFIIGGAAASYRRDVLTKLGGFDTDIITEDIEISLRILSLGYKTRYAADAITYTEAPSDYKGWCNQRLRWKFGRFQTLLRYRDLFFSSHKKHNKYLTFITLPIAIYGEFILLCELLLVTLFLGYSFYSGNYAPLVLLIALMTTMTYIQLLCDHKPKHHLNLWLFAPIAWILFYLVDIIEFQALFRSLKRLILGRTLQWQRWVREGINN